MFVTENMNEIINALFGDLGLLLCGLAIVLFFSHLAKICMARAVCLRASYKMTNDFYDKAEKLLRDPVVSNDIKTYVLDLTEAVTNPELNKIALGIIIDSISSTSEGDKKLRADNALEDSLDELRSYRTELVDTFYDAIRLAFGSILLSSNKDDPRVSITYANHNAILALLGIVDKKLREFAPKNHNGPGQNGPNHCGEPLYSAS